MSNPATFALYQNAMASTGWWGRMSCASDILWTRAAGRSAIDAARASRCQAMIAFARARSAYYRHAWQALPQRELLLADLPIVTKAELMSHFDSWVTDPAVHRTDVEAFLADRANIGQRYRGHYLVWKSSGTTGEHGIYVQDETALATYDALLMAQLQAVRLAGSCSWGMLAHGGRAALIAAIDDHFASIASWQHAHRDTPWLDARAFSILTPLPQLVTELNAYQPAFLASYPTMLAQLATEQAAGRLHIAPSCLWAGGEYLAPATSAAIERDFDCALVNEYGASECMSIAHGCSAGWLHVNADWVVLEPVDRDYRPVPAGEPSHTVLLTNLANRVQPLVRYDLGDSVVAKVGPCECGSPLPAMRVAGRCDDVMSFRSADGRMVALLPLALTTIVEDAANVHRFQLVQQAPDRLALRLESGDKPGRQQCWHAAASALRSYLATQSLSNVQVVLDHKPPSVDAHSGKLRAAIVEPETRTHAH